MKDDMSRVLIWGCSWGILALIANLVTLSVYGSMAGAIVSLSTTLILTPVCFWGGMMVRKRGYIFSKKIL